jgi:hypothetical protein
MRERLAVLCVFAAAGCGGVPGHHPSQRRPSRIAEAQATHEYPSPVPRRQRVSAASRSPSAAVAAFASAYINWTAGTVSSDMRRLAARSIGQARAATQLAAAQTAGDYELRRGGIGNTGSVEAVAPLAGRPGQYIVVTRELTTATATTAYQGLQPAWHVAVATVQRIGAVSWVVSGWEPQS